MIQYLVKITVGSKVMFAVRCSGRDLAKVVKLAYELYPLCRIQLSERYKED